MKLELYHFESCPYCVKVRNYIDRADHSQITYYEYPQGLSGRRSIDENER